MNDQDASTCSAICKHCGGEIAIRNPTGKCDHLYWPDMLTEEAKLANGFRLVTRQVWERPLLCFQHGGSEACEARNRQNGFTCPKCSNKELSPSSTVSPKDTDALLATIRKHVEKIPCHDCRSVPCWYCELKRLIANGH